MGVAARPGEEAVDGLHLFRGALLSIAESQGEGRIEAIRARLRDPSPHLGGAPECAEVMESLLPRRS
eukprot:1980127-Alexandrium_andersonii.AAC.1